MRILVHPTIKQGGAPKIIRDCSEEITSVDASSSAKDSSGEHNGNPVIVIVAEECEDIVLKTYQLA